MLLKWAFSIGTLHVSDQKKKKKKKNFFEKQVLLFKGVGVGNLVLRDL